VTNIEGFAKLGVADLQRVLDKMPHPAESTHDDSEEPISAAEVEA